MMLAKSLQSAAGNAAGEANYIEDVFSTYLYTGNGSTQTITNGIDLSGEGGMVWFKRRNAVSNHRLYDTARGMTSAVGGAPYLYSNDGAGNLGTGFAGSVVATSSGFDIAQGGIGDISDSGGTYASWTFRKQPKFFDVVTFSTTSSSSVPITVNHNLGSVPGCIIVKKINTSGGWNVYHRSLGAFYLGLSSTGFAQNGGTSKWYSTPTATSFTLGGDFVGNDTYVAYLFAHNAGGFGLSGEDNVISCGSFTTDGSGNTALQDLGWEPQFLMTKVVSTTGNWLIQDSMRGFVSSTTGQRYLYPNLSNAESGATDGWQPTATGFQDVYASQGPGRTYIYIAIRRGPMKVPESGTSVFEPDLSPNSNNPRFVSGFPVDMAMSRLRTSDGVEGMDITSRLTHLQYMRTGSTNAEATSSTIRMDYMNGFDNDGDTSPNWVAHMFRRAPGFFDVVAHTSNGDPAQQIFHNLTVTPELAIIRDRTGANWFVYHKNVTAGKNLILNTTGAEIQSNTGTAAAFTDSYYTPGNSGVLSGGGNTKTYVTYLFATCAGVSKVGSYTGTATTQQINCGFTGGARFVLIKRTDSTGGWYVWDSARGIVAGNDPYLLLNSTAAEVTSTDYIDTYSAGFEISSTAPAAINASGGTFIFLAIA